MKRRNTPHQHTPEEERRIREAALDQTIAESFPASDPPSTIPNPDNHVAIETGAAARVMHDDALRQALRTR
jgi:hypothetical protein